MERNSVNNVDLVTYVKNQLHTRLPLSSLYKTFYIEGGIFTILPENANFLDFYSSAGNKTSSISIATDEIVNYLNKNTSNGVIIEYANARKGDSWLDGHNLKYLTYESYIYSIFTAIDFNYEDKKEIIKIGSIEDDDFVPCLHDFILDVEKFKKEMTGK